MTLHVRGLFCFVSHPVKSKTEDLNQPFFSLTETCCTMITDVLGSYIKTEIHSVFVQRDKSVLAHSLSMHVFFFYHQSFHFVRLHIFFLSNEPSVLSTQPKNIAFHPELSVLIQTICVSMGRSLACPPSWAGEAKLICYFCKLHTSSLSWLWLIGTKPVIVKVPHSAVYLKAITNASEWQLWHSSLYSCMANIKPNLCLGCYSVFSQNA